MATNVLDSYAGERVLPPRVRSFLSILEESSFTLALTQPKKMTIRVLRDGKKVGYVNDSVVKHNGLIGYHFVGPKYSSDSCPPELAPRLIDTFCERYACAPTALDTQRDNSAKGANSGRTFLHLLDATVALRILQTDAGAASDDEFVVALVGNKYVEGKLTDVMLKRRERDRNARAACIAAYGFSCYICQANLKERYVGLPMELVHVHHEEPLSAAAGEREFDPVATMKPLCPNCHCVLHSKIPAYSIEEVRQMLRREI